jgi:hypothetical protein
MCTDNWSGTDEYIKYADCHVWDSFYLIANLLTLFHAIFNLGFSIKRLAQHPTRLARLICLGCVLLIFYYVARLATGMVLGDHDVLLNLVHGVGYGILWIAVCNFALQYLTVMLSTEKIQEKTEGYVPKLSLVLNLFMLFSFVSEVLVLVLPAAIPHQTKLVLFPTYLIFILVRAAFLISTFLYIGWVVHQMLNQMGKDGTFFMRLRHRLDYVMMSWAGIMVGIIVFILMNIKIPALAQNQYILTPLMLNMFQGVCGFILYSSKRKIYQDTPSVKSNTDEPQEVSKKGQDSISRSTSHGGAPLETSLPYRAHHHHPPSTLLPNSHSGSPHHLHNKSQEGPLSENHHGFNHNNPRRGDREESIASASAEPSRLDVSVTGPPITGGGGTGVGNQTPSHHTSNRTSNQREESKDFTGIEISIRPSQTKLSSKKNSISTSATTTHKQQPSLLPSPPDPELDDIHEHDHAAQEKDKEPVGHEPDIWVQ